LARYSDPKEIGGEMLEQGKLAKKERAVTEEASSPARLLSTHPG
jgi:hypothetical protein